MRLAFYAPLKPPNHANPSGDRAMARGLLAALQGIGAEVTLASVLRSRDGSGDPAIQRALITEAGGEIARLIPEGRAAGWQCWLTYHNYYKAPDLIGPAVAAALDIPYLLVEASRAQKRLIGPWANFARAAEAACDAARVIFYVTGHDAETLQRDAPEGQALIHLRPFLDRSDLPPDTTGEGGLLSVGMMRPGDKLASYRIIAETLALLPPHLRDLRIIGDGAARPKVEALMAPFGGAVRFLGALDSDAIAMQYRRATAFFWPGVNEAFGMAYLEAQAHGLPVIVQDRPGVRDVLAPEPRPDPAAGPAALAAQIAALSEAPDLRRHAGARARAHIAAHHLRDSAETTLKQGLALCGVLS
ncbi:glycosyltransferase family 4 protein [Sulfitobacter aestuarii]|uniref:Glycosyltransferase family 4 protein n=1 Tax=Sulfitobacter aestuarii TaxID=2161676 RepID=A0ABW5U6T8_9RHOB